MKIKNSKSKIYVKSMNEEIGGTPMVFFHGFTGCSKDWLYITKKINKWSIIIDIPGHASSLFEHLDSPYTIDDLCHELYLVFNELKLKKIYLVGYSMGGQIAIAYASKYPDNIDGLYIESSSLGIDDHSSRKDKYNADLLLCGTIEDNINVFVDKWESNPLFSNQRKRNYLQWDLQRKNRLGHDKMQLSKALQSFSKGKMPYYENTFKEFNFPIFIINGTDDDKYVKIGKKMTYMNINAKQYIIAKASHNIHLENPGVFVSVLNNEFAND